VGDHYPRGSLDIEPEIVPAMLHIPREPIATRIEIEALALPEDIRVTLSKPKQVLAVVTVAVASIAALGWVLNSLL